MNPHAHIPKNFDTLEVGGYYMSREGIVRPCTDHRPHEVIYRQFYTVNGFFFCPNGNWLKNGRQSLNDLTHRVNPDGSLWTGEAEATQTPQEGRIHIRTITLELAQTLPSGEEQTIIVEVTGTDEIITTDPSWTNGAVGLSDIIGTATRALDMAKGRIARASVGMVV